MTWKMVTRHGKNMTLNEAVEEIKAREEDRKLVSKFEAEHRDAISKILGLIDYIDKIYIEEKFPEIYNKQVSETDYAMELRSTMTTELLNPQ